METSKRHVIIVGAGIGGLAAALRLSHAGCAVTVLEQHAEVGGKMRVLPSAAGPVDAGPTVLTLRPVFDALFADCGLTLSDHVQLRPLDVIARHYWEDGTRFDLLPTRDATMAEVHRVFGARSASDYARFADRAARLFAAFDAPMMQAAQPRSFDLIRHVIRQPRLIWDMAPGRSLAGLLDGAFSEPKLAQLFGRYATYVGGDPRSSPALLSLISDAEAQGVWAVEGGMNRLAQTLKTLAERKGATFQFNSPVRRIEQQGQKIHGVDTDTGRISADAVVFNGDPRALQQRLLGRGVAPAIPRAAVEPRSLSAYVQAFAARPSGIDLAHHTVFFSHQINAEFGPIAQGQMPQDATVYLCAQDHGQVSADALQRFEVIVNAPPVPKDETMEKPPCQTLIFDRFKAFGLRFSPEPSLETLTTPAGFDRLFPASQGSLYGRSPHGMTAGMKRPTARTRVKGLYLVGGGAHPGAGVPMATLSARHAAEAIMQDLCLTSTSPQTAMPGGTSTGSAPMARKPSLS